jgi:S1-C subfamily serine protease
MGHVSKITRRAVLIAAVLMATTAVMGFSQNALEDPMNGDSGRLPGPGVLVVSVVSGSPAEKAGVTRGDVIMEINGVVVNTQAETRHAVDSHKAGDTITLKLRHGDAEKTLSVALGSRDGRAYMGVLLFPVGGERLGMMGNASRNWSWLASQGAVVSHVSSGSPADKAGLKSGDLILSVDGISVDANHHLSSLIHQRKSGETITLSVQSGWPQSDKGPRDMRVMLGHNPDGNEAWLGVSYRVGSPIADLMRAWDGRNGFGGPGFAMPEPTMPGLATTAM